MSRRTIVKLIALSLAVIIFAVPLIALEGTSDAMLLAQIEMEDVVYLKDGSIIRGQIIEQIPNVSVKIQTKDGSLFVYKMEKILKITKEPLKKAGVEVGGTQAGGYSQGKADGRRDGNAAASPLWGLAGLGCGCFGVGAAFLIAPPVPGEKLIGKSADYVNGYSEGYKSAVVMRQVGYASAGWLIWLVIWLAITGFD